MPIVLITLAVGIALGWFLYHMRFKGAVALAEEALAASQTSDNATPALPPSHSTVVSPRPDEELQQLKRDLLRPIRCRHCGNRTEFFTAKQILDTHRDAHGFPKEPQYPGGLNGWYTDHGLPHRKSEEMVRQSQRS